MEHTQNSFKTDRPKGAHFSFGGKLLTDKKSPQFFYGSIFNPTHHSLPFCVLFLAVGMDLIGKRCGRELGGQFGQFIAKSPIEGTLVQSQITVGSYKLPLYQYTCISLVGNS